MNELLEDCKKDMEKRLSSLEKQLSRVRTGRASTALLEGVRVDYYGSQTPLNQVASISVPDARTIVITPFEKKILKEIEKSIQLANLGIQPTNDGSIIRLPVPPLNEERRKEIAKSIRNHGEETKVAIRLVRQDYNNKIRVQEKQKLISEDELKQYQKSVQDITDSFAEKTLKLVGLKEKDILTL